MGNFKKIVLESTQTSTVISEFLLACANLSLPVLACSCTIESSLWSYSKGRREGIIPFCCIKCCLVSQSCLIPCNPVDCKGLPVLHHLPDLAQTHVHWVMVEWCHPTILFSVIPFSSSPWSFPASEYFPMSRLSTSDGQSIGNSTSASVLQMNIQGWFHLGFTGLISLLSKGLSRSFFSTTIQKHQFFGTQPSLWSISHIHISHIHTWLLKKP